MLRLETLDPATVKQALAKSQDWHGQRRLGIGGSDAGKIMSGEWYKLWLEKTGRAESPDLSDNLAVVMGTWSEALNRYWFERNTGMAVDIVPGSVLSDDHPFMRANLDGSISGEESVWEGKHVGAYAKDEEIVSRYYAQCQHLMTVTGATVCYLSVFFGSNRWQWFDVERDESFIAELVEKERDFWGYVERDEMPPDVEAAAPVEVAFDDLREVDMSTNNAWVSFATDWTTYNNAHKLFETAATELKALVLPDVKLAWGAGVKISRSKGGSLTIKEAK